MARTFWRLRPLIALFAVVSVYGQSIDAAAAKVREAEAALREAQESYKKALLEQAAALRAQADAIEAKARGAVAPVAGTVTVGAPSVRITPVAAVAAPATPVPTPAVAAQPPAPAPPPTPQPAPAPPAAAPKPSSTTGAKLTANPAESTLENGEQQRFQVKLGDAALKKTEVTVGDLDSDICKQQLEVSWSADDAFLTVTANKLPKGVPRVNCVLGLAAASDATKKAKIALAVLEEKSGEWEARSVFGLHQAGASSADSKQNYFFDFFIMRGLGRHAKVYDSPINLWGNVRIASAPQQIDSSVASFISNFATEAGKLQVNKLAQSGEFLTGVGVKIKAWPQGGERVRMFEAVGFWGANGAFKDPGTGAQIYAIPEKTSPHWPVFQRNFGNELDKLKAGGVTPDPKFVAFVPPDRERFYRQYGAGLRLTTFETQRPYAPPATYMFTLGRDQLITEGLYKGIVARADVFYPLPVYKKDGKFNFLFLFATANLRLSKPTNLDVLALQPASTDKKIYDSDTMIISRPSARDTYRIGAGIDFINLFNSWRASAGAPK